MMLNTVYNTVNIGGLCNPQEVLTEANYLVKIEMVDGSSQLVQISKEQAIALGIEFSDTTEVQSEVINVENVGAVNTNSIQLKFVPSKTQYNYKVIQPEDLNLRPNLPVPALALPRGRPKKRTPSDHIETKQEPPPKIIKRARTRCGRISRPPVHMEKVFKLVSSEDPPAEQKTNSKPTQTEKQSEPLPPIHKKMEKPEPPTALQQPAKKKRVISGQYRCSTCHKAYLGRNRMAQHLKKHPDHGLNSHLNLDDNEAWECLIETALKSKEGQKGNKFCKEFMTLVKNARILAKYFFKPAKIGKAEYHVDDFLSGLLNLKVGDYRFNENELCKDVSIFSFLEYFDDNFITSEVKQKPEQLKNDELVGANEIHEPLNTNEIDVNLRGMNFLNENINESRKIENMKPISLSDELNDMLKTGKIEIDKTASLKELNKINSLNEKINKLDVSFVNTDLNKINLLNTQLNKMDDTFLNIETNKINNKTDTFTEMNKTLDYLNKIDENNKLSINTETALKPNEDTLKINHKANVDLHFGSEIIDVIKSASPKNDHKQINYYFGAIYPENKESKQSGYGNLFMYGVEDKRKENEDKNHFRHVFNNKGEINENRNNFRELQYDGIKKNDENECNKGDFGVLLEDSNKRDKGDFENLSLFDGQNGSKHDFGDLFEEKNKTGKNNFGDLFEEKNKSNKNDYADLFEEKDKVNKNNFTDLFIEKNKSDKNHFVDLFEEKSKVSKNTFTDLFEGKNKTNKSDFSDLLFDAQVMNLNLLPSPEKGLNKEKIEVRNFDLNLLSTPEKEGRVKNFNLNLLSTPEKEGEVKNLKCLNVQKMSTNLESTEIEVRNFNINLLSTPKKNSVESEGKLPASHQAVKEIIGLDSSEVEVTNFNLNLLSTPGKEGSGSEVKNVNLKEIEVKTLEYDSFLSGKKEEVRSLDFAEKSGGVEVMDLHKLHLLSDELILPEGEGVVTGILDTSTNSDDIMNVDQFVNERFKKLTGADDEVMSGLDLPHLDCFSFHPS